MRDARKTRTQHARTQRVALAPAAQRAAESDIHGHVEDNMAEQTAKADDAGTDEERERERWRQRPGCEQAGAADGTSAAAEGS
jgi:hypothetical protein